MSRQLDLVVQGILGTNPVLSRVGAEQRPYCRFRVATTPSYRTERGWNDGETIWFTAKAWGQLAEHMCMSLRKGEPVLLAGRFTQETWESERGTQLTNVLNVHAGGHDLTWGETRFMRVQLHAQGTASASTPDTTANTQSGAGSPDTAREPGAVDAPGGTGAQVDEGPLAAGGSRAQAGETRLRAGVGGATRNGDQATTPLPADHWEGGADAARQGATAPGPASGASQTQASTADPSPASASSSAYIVVGETQDDDPFDRE
ncbi:single-stranded DNA-binding protein [Actinomyces oricola]|uniref:single-stranded DNA-binding protein n=1 Tax=Actinomyces oricola TaxID=206043 RepID=UPI000FFE65B8|nr:single-stranded DNA-binding protein [Actinomyces oricola]